MFDIHRIANVTPCPDIKLSVRFQNDIKKIYDVKQLFDVLPQFKQLESNPDLFNSVKISPGGYAVIWNDELDLACDELWVNGIIES